jgi:nitrogen fixation protein FixH
MIMTAAILQTPARRFNWKYFPRIMIGIMLLVMAVNVRFITLAIATFPGTASSDDFDTSNRYNAVLDADARQAALGWRERASVNQHLAVLDLSGPSGAPLAGAIIQVHAARPLGADQAIPLAFRETVPGHFVATTTLPLPGQWDLQCRINSVDHVALVTRRIVVQ